MLASFPSNRRNRGPFFYLTGSRPRPELHTQPYAAEIETREEYYRNLGKKGGEKLAALRKGEKGLPRDELGPLEDAEDAMRWLTLIGYAIGESVISPKAGHALVRCVSEWRETKAESAVSEEVDELRELVEELVEEREKAPW